MNLLNFSCLIFLLSFYTGYQEHEKDLLSRLKQNIEKEQFEDNIILYERADLGRFDCVEKGRIHHQLGLSYYNLDKEDQAIEAFKKATEVWKNCKGIPDEEVANTIYNIGVSYQYTSSIYLGKNYIDTALYIYESLDSFPAEKIISKYEGAASFYSDLKDFFRAELLFKNAELKYQSIQSDDLVFPMLNRLVLYIEFRKYKKGFQLFNEIESLLSKNDELLDDYHKSIFYLNAGNLFLKMNQLDKCFYYTKKAQAILPKEEHNLLSNVHEILGTYYSRKNELNLAEIAFEKALNYRMSESSIFQKHLATAYAYENISDLLLKRGKHEEALEYINKGIRNLSGNQVFDVLQNPSIKDHQYPVDLVRQLLIKERIFFEMDSSKIGLEKCLSIHQKIDSLIDESISKYASENTRLELKQIIEQHSETAISRLFKLNKLDKNIQNLEKAFYYSSKAKSQIMAQGMNDQLVFNQLGDAKTLNAYRTLQDELKEVKELLLETDISKDSLLFRQNEILTELEVLKTSFLNKTGGLKNNESYFKIKSVNEIMSLLNKEQLLVDFFIGKENSYGFFIDKDNFEAVEIVSHSLNKKILEHKEMLNAPSDLPWRTTSKYLYETLFSNKLITAKQKGITDLIILSDGSLNYISLESLVNDEDVLLIYDFNISYLYSTAFLKNAVKRQYDFEFVGMATPYSKDLDQKLISLGYIDKTENYGQLSMSEKELLSCKAVYKNKYLLGKEASVDNFFRYASKSKILYLSMHGILDDEENERTALLFDDQNPNFILSAFELYKNKIETDLVILSACHSAGGKLYQGEGTNGLSKAFIASGASSVVSSLWPATELSASMILPNFLKYLKSGKSKTEALRLSKLDYLKSVSPGFQHPYYWSNFILLGDIEAYEKGFEFSDLVSILGLVSIILLVIFTFRKFRNIPN
ncbi:MAG TPA: CHAT domain-containing protein [Saprospiraceae bacterium]|nr:CHAT domain-containing protein [Saprospiraceae bacterium]